MIGLIVVYCGSQPSSRRARLASATRAGGSPARGPVTTAGMGWPVTSRQASMTSLTLDPRPVPRLSFSSVPLLQPIERRQVRGGQVIDVNVVANTGAVGSG